MWHHSVIQFTSQHYCRRHVFDQQPEMMTCVWPWSVVWRISRSGQLMSSEVAPVRWDHSETWAARMVTRKVCIMGALTHERFWILWVLAACFIIIRRKIRKFITCTQSWINGTTENEMWYTINSLLKTVCLETTFSWWQQLPLSRHSVPTTHQSLNRRSG